MALTNNNQRIIDLLNPQVMFDPGGTGWLGQVSAACNDIRGTDRYIYICPTNSVQLYRYDTWFNVMQRLANPPAYSGTGAMALSVADNAVYLVVANALYRYDIATNVWTTKATLPGSTSTGTSICTTDTVYAASGGNNDYLYVSYGLALYRYSISGNTWTTLTAAPTSGALGQTLLWLPGWDATKLVRIRGTGYADVNIYDITGNSWTTSTFSPSGEVSGTIPGVPYGYNATLGLVQSSMGAVERWFTVDPSGAGSTAPLLPLTSGRFLRYNSTASNPNTCYVKVSAGIEYLYRIFNMDSTNSIAVYTMARFPIPQ